MSREVTVEELRERLEEIIAEVEAGGSVTVVKELSPKYTGQPFPFRGIDFGPRPKNLRTDPTDLIREDRDSEFRKHGL